MKHIAFSLAVLSATSLTGLAVAAPVDNGDSILQSADSGQAIVGQARETLASTQADALEHGFDQAPMPPMPLTDEAMQQPAADAMQAPMPVAEMPQPIVDNSVSHHSAHVHTHQPAVRYHRVKKKQNVFQKMMELERKKNAWLKKTFLGL